MFCAMRAAPQWWCEAEIVTHSLGTYGNGIGNRAREEMLVKSMKIDRRDFVAAIFDLDGVLTDTARVHAAAWKTVFDAFLRRWTQQHGLAFRPFDIEADYLAYVDGRPRYDGVRSFLASRGMNLPEGSEHDPEDANTVHALGERKARLFRQALQKGIDQEAGAAALLKALRQVGVRIAVASSSKNCSAILTAAELNQLIDIQVDGVDAEELGLLGKPDPALFLEAARRLAVQPSRTILFEDALAGVEAGKRGGFGCVVGIDRACQSKALLERGADIVIQGLLEVDVKG
jgi:alpha,alpha-trehalase